MKWEMVLFPSFLDEIVVIISIILRTTLFKCFINSAVVQVSLCSAINQLRLLYASYSHWLPDWLAVANWTTYLVGCPALAHFCPALRRIY